MGHVVALSSFQIGKIVSEAEPFYRLTCEEGVSSVVWNIDVLIQKKQRDRKR